MPFNFAPQDNFGSGLAKGAESALQNFIMPGMQAREQSKLALQMLNARIDKEQAAKQGEMTFASNLAAAPSDEVGAIANWHQQALNALEQRKPMPAFDASQVKSSAGQQEFFKAMGDVSTIAAHTAGIRPIPVKTSDASGNIVLHMVDPMSGTILNSDTVGLTPAATKNLTTADTDYQNMTSLAQRVEKTIKNIHPADNAAGAAWQSGKLKLQDYINTDPNAKMLMDTIPTDATTLEKYTVGGGLRISPQLKAMVTPALFSPNDTSQSIALKLQRIHQMAYDNVKNVYQSNGPTKLPQYVQDPSAVQAAQAQAASTPAGIDFAAEDQRRASLKQQGQTQGQ